MKVKVELLKDFATKKKGDEVTCCSMIASSLITRKVAKKVKKKVKKTEE